MSSLYLERYNETKAVKYSNTFDLLKYHDKILLFVYYMTPNNEQGTDLLARIVIRTPQIELTSEGYTLRGSIIICKIAPNIDNNGQINAIVDFLKQTPTFDSLIFTRLTKTFVYWSYIHDTVKPININQYFIKHVESYLINNNHYDENYYETSYSH